MICGEKSQKKITVRQQFAEMNMCVTILGLVMFGFRSVLSKRQQDAFRIVYAAARERKWKMHCNKYGT